MELKDRTLYYYNVFIKLNGKVTDIHLGDLLDEIRSQETLYRLKSLKQGHLCLMEMAPPESNRDYNDRKVVIGKFRDDKPYLSELGTNRIEEINDDIVELTSVFYVKNSRLAIIEYNHYGMRPNAFVYYLNSFFPKTIDDKWEVVLEQIEPKLGFTDVAGSKDIKSVNFKVDLTAKEQPIYNLQNSEQSYDSVLGNLLMKSIETNREFGANYADIGFSNGRKWRKNVIDPDQLVKVLRGIDLESDSFESIKVTYVSPKTGKKETIDLKNQGVLKEIISLDSGGWQYTCDKMEEYFYDSGRIGENNHKNYEIGVNTKLPQLVFNNKGGI